MRKLAIAVLSILFSSGALAQGAGDVVGTWLFVSSIRDSEGGKMNTYGAGAEGRMILDGGGHYSITIIGANLPKFA